MVCPKCGSTNVTVQIVTQTKLKNAHHGIIWWFFVGWWWILVKWLCFFWLALLAKIFAPKKQKLSQKNISMCACQSCGHSWKA